MAAGATTRVLTAFAEHLAAEITDPLVAWSATGSYSATPLTTMCIFIATVPSAPHNAITLTAYGSPNDDPDYADSTMNVQVRSRTAGQDPRTTDDLADALFDALQGWTATLAADLRIIRVSRISSLPLGQDTNRRWERADNYAVTLHRASRHRL